MVPAVHETGLRPRVRDALHAFAALGDRPGDGDEARQHHRLLIAMGILMSGGGLLWGTLCLAFGFHAASAIPYGYVVLTALNLAFFHRTKRFGTVRFVQVAMSLLLPVLFQLALGGFVRSGASMLWSLLALGGSLTFSEVRLGVRWLVLYVVGTVICGVFDGAASRLHAAPIEPWVTTAFFVVNISVITSIFFFLTLQMLAAHRRIQGELAAASARVQQLAEGLEEQVRERTAELKEAIDALTDERDAQERLRQRAAAAERTLQESLAAVGAGVWEADLVRDTAEWSDEMYRLMGYGVGAVEPSMTTWAANIEPADRERILALPPAQMQRYEFRVRQPDGTVRRLRSHMNTVLDEAGKAVRVRGITTDVTAEKQAAEQLARLAEVASRTTNAVIIADLAGRIEWVNEGFVRLTGHPLEEAVGRTPGALLQGRHTDPEVQRVMREAVARREPFEVDVLNYRKDGRPYWVHIESRVTRDAAGAPSGFVAVETDITERRIRDARDGLVRRIAEALLAAESVEGAVRAVVGALVREPDVVAAQLWLTAPGQDSLIWLAGESAPSAAGGARFVELTRGLALGRGDRASVPGAAWASERSVAVLDCAHDPGSGADAERKRAALASGIRSLTATPIVGPEGVLGVLEVASTAHFPGHERMAAILEPIAQQFASFLRHEQSLHAFEAIFSSSPDGLLLVEADGVVRGANARARELFGEPLGVAVADLLEGGAEVVEHGLGTERRAAEAALFNLSARGVRGTFAAEVSASAARSGATPLAILAVRDLSERRRMEEALTRSVEEKETLLREVHHRVKNNLQIVSSLVALQAERLPPGASREALSQMVFRVLSMAKVHQQLYGTEHFERVDLGRYANALAESLQSSLAPESILTCDTETVEATIDVAVPFGLILNELLTNAYKHGRIEDRCEVHISLRAEGDGFVLAVGDRGPGFDAERQRAGSLGMLLLRQLSRQLRAQLEFRSERGTEVTLRVPRLLVPRPPGLRPVPAPP